MSTTKVTDLTELTSAADSDVFLISDVDTSTSKKIQKSNITEQNFTTALKTKLDGVEANATADQTGAEIKTAYESEADTNAFTDAEKTKLSGIETGATADQSASEIKTAYESNSDTNAFTDAEQTKLSGIETNADVTDTTNVVAALTAGTNITIAGDGTISATDTDTGILNVVEDTTPQLGGNLDTNGNDITFGDNDKAIFGAGSDLQIYHTGTQSRIMDVGTGDLSIWATNFGIYNHPDGKAYVTATASDEVKLYYNNSGRLATTSTGVDVTGTVSATSFTGDGSSLTGIDALPDQTGHAGQYLTTDGTTADWDTIDTDANTTTKGLYEHAHTISANYTITSGNNAMSAGPVTVDTGYSVTVPSGSVWTII